MLEFMSERVMGVTSGTKLMSPYWTLACQVYDYYYITYSVLISSCFAWRPYEKVGLIKAE